jgi:hypothetical protein
LLPSHVFFITPPSIETLETRLRTRGTETEEKIKIRLETAIEEMKFCREQEVASSSLSSSTTTKFFDAIILNDDLNQCLEDFITLINKTYHLNLSSKDNNNEEKKVEQKNVFSDRFQNEEITIKDQSNFEDKNKSLKNRVISNEKDSQIKKGNNIFIGLDAGYTIGQPTREDEHYRRKNDIVSLLGSGATNMKTLDKNTNILNAHDVDNVKESKIFI